MSDQNNPLSVTKPGIQGLKALLAQPAFSKRFEEILGKRATQFVASIVSVAGTLPVETEPHSIIQSAIIAATLDLPINKELGYAWIVPYNNTRKNQKEAQFQMGHKGFIQLALRTGQYAGMNARIINAEAFGGYDSIGEPIIVWDKIDPEKDPIGYAFAFKLVGGFQKVCFWSVDRVRDHANRYSQAFRKGYDCPWKSHFDQMALKTVIKNELSDWGLMSVEMRQAQKVDQGVVIDVDSEIITYPDNDELAAGGSAETEIKKPEAPKAAAAKSATTAPAKSAAPAKTPTPAKAKTAAPAPAAPPEPTPPEPESEPTAGNEQVEPEPPGEPEEKTTQKASNIIPMIDTQNAPINEVAEVVRKKMAAAGINEADMMAFFLDNKFIKIPTASIDALAETSGTKVRFICREFSGYAEQFNAWKAQKAQ